MRHQSKARVKERIETDQCLVWFWFGKRAARTVSVRPSEAVLAGQGTYRQSQRSGECTCCSRKLRQFCERDNWHTATNLERSDSDMAGEVKKNGGGSGGEG